MKYRKKPVVIEAVCWSGGRLVELADFFGGVYDPHYDRIIKGTDSDAVVDGRDGWLAIVERDNNLTINTLEGPLRARHGDFIIRGVQGEFYPCKPDIFAATYEPIEEGNE